MGGTSGEDFSIGLEDEGPRAVRLTPAGELDIATAPALREAVREQRQRADSVVLDLSRLRFLDSTGLHLLLQLRRDADEEGWALEITSPVGEASRVIEVTRMAPVLRLTDTNANQPPG